MPDQPITHPTPEQLRAFSLGQLPDEESDAVENHIGECLPCCETVAGLASGDTFVALLQDAHEPCTSQTSAQLGSAEDTSTLSDDEIPPELVNHPRYGVIAAVGKGGMGNVFKAEHRVMERMVALKVIKRELFNRPQAVQRFDREVKTAAKLSHANIVAAFDAEQAGNVHFLVMEYVDGVDLARKVKNDGPLSLNHACDYIAQAANGLQHAHEQGMVHRDIKPHNLMLSCDGTVKILDFGLATLSTQSMNAEDIVELSEDEPVKTSRLTTLGTMMGTPDFIAPEQAGEPDAVDIRSDIYSLGCTFYYLLTGQPPFSSGSALERVKAHGEAEPEPIENIRADIPPDLAKVVRRMMAKSPTERFQTPVDVADELARFTNNKATMPTDAPTTEKSPSVGHSRRIAWPPTMFQTLCGAMFALMLATVVYVVTDAGKLVIESDDDSIEITIRSTNEVSDRDIAQSQMEIVDTVTGSTVKRLRSGQYVLELKADSEFELSKQSFVLRRGGKVVVRASRKGSADLAARSPVPDEVREDAESTLKTLGVKIDRNENGQITLVESFGNRVTDSDLAKVPLLDWGTMSRPVPPSRYIRELDGAPLHRMPLLRIQNAQITDEGLAHLRGLTVLRTLILHGNPRITDAGLLQLGQLTHLEELAISSAQITDAGLRHLAPLTDLRSLRLDGTNITDSALQHLNSLKNLRTLGLNGCQNITDAALDNLSIAEKLEGLLLAGNPQISDVTLKHVERMTKLQWLWCAGTSVSDAGLMHLRELNELDMLTLVGTKVSDVGIAHLSGLSKLRFLRLDGTEITDAGLVHLKNLKSLKWLFLRGTSITDEGVPHLSEMKSLERLIVEGTKLSESGIRKVKLAIPECLIDVVDAKEQRATGVKGR